MILNEMYLHEMKEHIKDMQGGYFIGHGLTKEAVLSNTDTMKRLWTIYQKDVEDYDCDRAFSLGDALNEVFGPEPKTDEPKYCCPFADLNALSGTSLSGPKCT